MKITQKVFYLIIGLALLLTSVPVYAGMAELPVRGKILLQVEDVGQAYYVPVNEYKRYYLGRPDDAFEVMSLLGIGISNENLTNIPVADLNLNSSVDSDGDGLSDELEVSFGTNPNNKDTDNDGYWDAHEIINKYSPLAVGEGSQMVSDPNFAKKHVGKIFLQVESKGEAWYVNPNDGRRYFLGRPADAFNLMYQLGLGISNDNLEKIPTIVYYKDVDMSGSSNGVTFGYSGLLKYEDDCGYLGCFDQEFRACVPQSHVIISFPMLEESESQYILHGQKDGKCEVSFSYLKMTMPEFKGKTMTCQLDNTKKFDDAVTEISTSVQEICSGSLVDIMYP